MEEGELFYRRNGEGYKKGWGEDESNGNWIFEIHFIASDGASGYEMSKLLE